MNPLEIVIYHTIPFFIIGLVCRRIYEAVKDYIALRRLKKRLAESHRRNVDLNLLLAGLLVVIELQKLNKKSAVENRTLEVIEKEDS